MNEAWSSYRMGEGMKIIPGGFLESRLKHIWCVQSVSIIYCTSLTQFWPLHNDIYSCFLFVFLLFHSLCCYIAEAQSVFLRSNEQLKPAQSSHLSYHDHNDLRKKNSSFHNFYSALMCFSKSLKEKKIKMVCFNTSQSCPG